MKGPIKKMCWKNKTNIALIIESFKTRRGYKHKNKNVLARKNDT